MKCDPKIMKLVSRLSTLFVAVLLISCDPLSEWRPPNDGTPGIAVDPKDGLVTTEAGGTDTFTVVLNSQPASDVTMGLSSSDLNEGMVNTSTLVFTPGNWDIPQTVSVTGVDDTSVDGNQAYTIITYPANSNDHDYSGLDAYDVSVTNIDDDTQPDVIDQQQPAIDKSVGVPAIGGSSKQILAQVVTVGISGPLLSVKLPIGGSSGDLVIEIQDVTGDKPNGTVLTSETFNSANYPAEDSDGMRRFALSTLIDFTTGSRFAIVLSSPGGSYGMFQGPIGNPYAGGDGFYDARPNTPGVWVPLSTRRDLPFKTIVHAQ